jgi:phosphonopyruvate decarboxylase
MINPQDFAKALKNNNIDFITGVPDSLLKDICAYITTFFSEKQHLIATNEGSAIALAIGSYLASGKVPLVYMQNSGLGNIINPLSSLADIEVYSIPIILLIGWRGELDINQIQIHDEPQHVKQGKITEGQLKLLGIPYIILDSNSDIINVIDRMHKLSLENSSPVAILVRKNTFSTFKIETNYNDNLLTRENVIEILANGLINFPIVSTTGMASRELFEIRKKNNQGHYRDFLTVGGMGHASQIAAGISLVKPDCKVVCLDGDGALLMHMGSMAISATIPNIIHIVLNNGSHDSVGGQPTMGRKLVFKEIADKFNYKLTMTANSEDEIKECIEKIIKTDGSCFLEINCSTGARKDLGRPDRSPSQNKKDFMNFLKI